MNLNNVFINRTVTNQKNDKNAFPVMNKKTNHKHRVMHCKKEVLYVYNTKTVSSVCQSF
jgi:hypothetical protein